MRLQPPLGLLNGLIQPDILSNDWREAAVGLSLAGVDVYPGWGGDRHGHCRCQIGRCRGDMERVQELVLLADRQRRVPPMCAPMKHPIGSHRAATRDWEIVQGWCADPNSRMGSPSNNLLVVTGRPGGIIALDIDGPTGEDSARALEAELGPFPPTVQVASGRAGGGRHLWFRHQPDQPIPANRASSILGPGIDVRGAGGYVVGPPSLHSSGRHYGYLPGLTPHDVEIAPLPAGLLQRLLKGSGEARPSSGPRAPRTPRERTEHERTLRPGDGPAHGGFDQPALKWSLRYFREMGVEADTAPLIEALREAFERAPGEPNRKFDLIRYTSDGYLRGRVEQAREMVASDPRSEQ